MLRSSKFSLITGVFSKLSSDTGHARHLSRSRVLQERSNYSPSYYYKMDSTHLTKGAPCPSLPSTDRVRIYSMRFCPFAQRAVLVALAKGIPHDVVNCNLKEKTDWLLQRNPLGKVPVLELPDGRTLAESLIVCDYLDDTYDSRRLHSLDPFQRAVDRVWIERFGKTISYFYKILFFKGDDPEAMGKYFEKFLQGMKDIDGELSRRKTEFFGGDNLPGMLDYMIWPWIERLPVMRSLLPADLHSIVEKIRSELPRLTRWEELMKEDFAVKEFILPTEVHKEFLLSLLSGQPNYNILDAKL